MRIRAVILACLMPAAMCGACGPAETSAEPAAKPAPLAADAQAGQKARPSAKQSARPEQKATAKKTAVQTKTARPAPSTQPAAGADFAAHAFPPTLSDTKYHRGAWVRNDCLRCHETGVGEAPRVRHRGMASILLKAKCRSCHVLIRGQKPRPKRLSEAAQEGFAPNAFPPMIPDSDSHRGVWTKDNCLLCHESGVKGAPIVRHRGMPPILLKAKCRSCHVQVRASQQPRP